MGNITMPWNKHFYSARSKCKYGLYKTSGVNFNINKEDVKFIWFRDGAEKMTNPSIDRIDTSKGYFKENCRFIEMSENRKRPRQKSKTVKNRFKGVHWQKDHNKYRTIIIKDGKQIHVGYFFNEEEAAIAYNCAIKLIFPKENININKIFNQTDAINVGV